MAVRSGIQMICFTYPAGRKHTLGFCLFVDGFKSRLSISVLSPPTSSSSSSSSLHPLPSSSPLHLLQSLILPLHPFGLCLLLLTRHSSHSPRCLSSVAAYLLEEQMNKYPCIRLLRGSKGKAIEILMGASLGHDGEKWGERIQGSGLLLMPSCAPDWEKRGWNGQLVWEQPKP